MTKPALMIDIMPLTSWSNGFEFLEPSVPGWYIDVVLGFPGLELREVRKPEACRSGAVALLIMGERCDDGSTFAQHYLSAINWIIEQYEGRVALVSDRDHWWRPAAEKITRVFYTRAEKPWNGTHETWLPLGWSFLFDPRADLSSPSTQTSSMPVSRRGTYVSFVGSNATSQERQTLLQSFESALPGIERNLRRHGAESTCKLLTHRRWARWDLAEKYRETITNSCFVFSPAGYYTETFRIYEALESGAIPVIVGTPDSLQIYVSRLASSFPGLQRVLPLFDSWPVAHQYLESFIGDEPGLQEEQTKVQEAWFQCKSDICNLVGKQLHEI